MKEAEALKVAGNICYYGQNGKKDYGKAYGYFSKGAELDDGSDSMWCKYKLADMYHNGYYVEKDDSKYRQLIEETYKEIETPEYLDEPYPEVSFRMAEILTDEDRISEAVALLIKAKRFLAERLSHEAICGQLETMARIVNLLYRLKLLNETKIDFYDLIRVTRRPCKILFKYNGDVYNITVSDEKDSSIRFAGKWYRNFLEMCEKATIGNKKITNIYDDLYDWEVVR